MGLLTGLKPVNVLMDGILPSSVSSAPHGLVSLANLLGMCSVPLSMSSTKMLNRAGAKPRGTLQEYMGTITDLHLDINH